MGPPRGRDGCTEQHHQPATVHRAPDDDVLSHAPQKKKKQDQQRAASLHDDVLIDILSQLHYRSLCRFKCVSKAWLALCSELDIHNRSPQTVSGYLGRNIGEAWLALCSELDIHNRSPQTVSGYLGRNIGEAFSFHDLTAGDDGYHPPPLVDPTLAFLGSYGRISVEQCCGGGLLLCKCWKESRSDDEDKYSYVVCNPATEKWTVLPPVELPDTGEDRLNKGEHKLGFDALNPSRFVVAVPMENSFGQVKQVAIYSSETGRWTSMQSQWHSDTFWADCADEAIFLNDTMHFPTSGYSIVTMDIEGKVWKEIKMPNSHGLATVGQSQGYLHYWCVDIDFKPTVWVLDQDYGSANWTLKHTVNGLELFGKHYSKDHKLVNVAIHLDCDLIFLTGWEMTISYDMDNQKVHVIYASKAFVFGVLYIPCFAKWPSRKVALPDSSVVI